MPADGFTKLLSCQKHNNFIKQLGMKDICHVVKKLPILDLSQILTSSAHGTECIF
jgi:hypothetical protein